jgi:Bacterial trigger factor protein (TF) C-terminus.
VIYYEAMMHGQNPQEMIKYYQKNNLLPAIKMGMIEDKLFSKLLGLHQ